MEQCRSVNPFMPTGVFNPFKQTDRSVIIGHLVLLTAVIFIILQKLLYHLTKQCRPLSDIISLIICLVSTFDLHCLSNSFIWVLDIIGLLKWLCADNVEMAFLSALIVYSSVNNLSVISGRFMNFWVKPVLSRTYKVSSWSTQHIGLPMSLEQVALQTLLLIISTICS